MGCITSTQRIQSGNGPRSRTQSPTKSNFFKNEYDKDFRPSITKFLRSSLQEVDRVRDSLAILCKIAECKAAFIACRHPIGIVINVSYECRPADVDDLIPRSTAESIPNYRTKYVADIQYNKLVGVQRKPDGPELIPILVIPMQDKSGSTVGYLAMCGLSPNKLIHNCMYNFAQVVSRDIQNRADAVLANTSEAVVILDTTAPQWKTLWTSFKWQSLMLSDMAPHKSTHPVSNNDLGQASGNTKITKSQYPDKGDNSLMNRDNITLKSSFELNHFQVGKAGDIKDKSLHFWDILRDDRSRTPSGPMTLLKMPDEILKRLGNAGNITTVSLVPKVPTQQNIVYTVAFERLCNARYLIQPAAQGIQDVDNNQYCARLIVAKICAVVNDTLTDISSNREMSIVNSDESLPVSDLEITIGKLLGKGGYGSVYSAVWEGREIALKIQEEPIQQADSIFSHDFNPTKKTVSEFEVAQHLDHSNIVKTFKSQTRRQGDRLQTWILMELCNNGSLRQAMEANYFNDSGSPNMNRILHCLCDIAAGMTYLHEQEILHGDLSGNNVLFDKDWRAKISDFGLSRTFMGGTCETQTYGTVSVMPQELLSQGILSRKSDVYAFGVLMFEIYTSSKAWNGMRHAQIISAKLRPSERLEFPSGSDVDYVKLTENCMAYSYHERPDFSSVKQALQQWIDCL